MKWIDSLKTAVVEEQATRRLLLATDDAPGPKREPIAALTEDEQAEYDRLAAKIGFVPKGLETDALKRFLAERGVRAYPLAKVEEYLNKQYGVPKTDSASATWIWRPLRSADTSGPSMWINGIPARHRYLSNGAIARDDTPYGKPLPLPVLLRVDEILERFPQAKFFVSDEYHAPPIADPFLAVFYGEAAELLVIERWDEPTFRG